MERQSLTFAPAALTVQMRAMVGSVIAAHCDIRSWTLHTVNARATHVHAVVTATGMRPEVVMTQFKAWSTRRLREASLLAADQRLWTRHGSTRYLWDDASLERAIVYVRDHQ